MSVVSLAGLTINAALVTTIAWEHRHYVNGSEATLVITFLNGTQRRVPHAHGCDAYALERQLREATGTQR